MTEIKALKKKKPVFVRRDSRYKSRVSSKWRKPRGRHSPVRQKHKGKPKLVSIGYGSPQAVKNLHPSGLQKVIIHNKNQLENLDLKTQGLILSRTLGSKKKIELIKHALEKNLPFLNLKDPQKHLEKLQSQFEERKKSKKKKLTEKEKREQEKKKKAEEKAKKEEEEKKKTEEKSAEEIREEKEEEKKEIEKTLIKKQ